MVDSRLDRDLAVLGQHVGDALGREKASTIGGV